MPNPGYSEATATASPTPAQSGAIEEVVRFSRFEFYGGDKQGTWGTVWQVNVDGKAVLRFAEDFRTVNGSALEVILIESAEPARQEIAEGYKLADLKALEGTQDYEIPILPSPLTKFANLGNDGSGVRIVSGAQNNTVGVETDSNGKKRRKHK